MDKLPSWRSNCKLCANPLYMNINSSVTVRHAPTPDLPVDFLSSDNAIRLVGHCNKHFELANCQGCADASDQRLSVVEPKLKGT